MKDFKRIFVILIGFISILTIRSFASTGTINIEATRLRKQNNTTSDILTKIYKNEEVEIVEEVGEWVKIKYKEYTGYIKKQYVDIKEESSSNQISTGNQDITNQVTVSTTTTLRLLPSFISKSIEQIEQGTNVTVDLEMNKWVKVTNGNISGWVLKSKLNIKSETPQIDSSDIETVGNTTQVNHTVENKIENKINNVTNNIIHNKVSQTSNTTNSVENKVNNSVTVNETERNTAQTVSKKGKINVETAKVRKGPSTSEKMVDLLDKGDIVTILEETNEWYKIEHGNIKGYVSKTLITLIEEKESVSSRSLAEERTPESKTTAEKLQENMQEEIQKNEQTNIKDETSSIDGQQVVALAKKYIGYPYVSGGKTPESGFDCSGFTRYVFKNFGYTLSSISYEQTSIGTEVTRENLQPGDLILFYNESKTKIGHTGIYIGNGEFIHAANAKRGVVCDNLNTLSYYNERFVTARRIVE